MFDHLCDVCIYTYADCNAPYIEYAIDRDSTLRGKEAGRIIGCEKFIFGEKILVNELPKKLDMVTCLKAVKTLFKGRIK